MEGSARLRQPTARRGRHGASPQRIFNGARSALEVFREGQRAGCLAQLYRAKLSAMRVVS